jgi:hypothetical protein
MKSRFGIYWLVGAFLVGGSLHGQETVGSDGSQQEPDPEQVQQETQDGVQNQLGPLADDLRQLRLQYREQVKVLLQERERLIQLYRLATEEEQMAIRKQIREHQVTIAETHRQIRRELRDQIRQIRHDRRRQIDGAGG